MKEIYSMFGWGELDSEMRMEMSNSYSNYLVGGSPIPIPIQMGMRMPQSRIVEPVSGSVPVNCRYGTVRSVPYRYMYRD